MFIKAITTLGLATASILAPLASHAADDFPNKPLRIILGFAAGGPTDHTARTVAKAMSENLKQPIVIENRPGANSTIAITALKNSAPDGYTLILSSNGPLTVAGARYKSLPFDPVKDFAPIGSVASYSWVLALPPGEKQMDLKALIAEAKAAEHPKNMSAVGHSEELSIANLQKLAGIKLNAVPYGGQSAVLTDLQSGRIDISFLAPSVARPLIEANKIRAVAVTGNARVDSLPSIPTIQEAGIPGFSVELWNALLAPAGTSPDRIEKLSKSLHQALESKEVRETLELSGLYPTIDTPQDLADRIATEGEKWKAVARDANIELLDF